MVQEGQDWRSIGLIAGGALALGIGLAAVRARRRPKTLRDRLAEEFDVRSAVESLRETIDEVREHLPEDGKTARRVVEQRLKPLAVTTRRELPKRTRRAVRQLEAERAHLAQVLDKDIAPATQRLVQDVLHEAENILGIARQRTGEVTGRLQAELPGRARARVAEVAQAVRRAAPDRIRLPGKELRARARPARSAPARLASGVGRVLSEALALGFWAGVAGALVYYGLLNEEQRARVREAIDTAWTQIRDLWADFQSEDTAFTELSQ